jgi:hypothetical protein
MLSTLTGRSVINAGETLNLDGVAALFGAEPETVALYARTGELPGTRIGKGWIFLREDALAFLRQRIARDTAARRAAQAKNDRATQQTEPPSPQKSTGVLLEHRSRQRRSKLPPLPILTLEAPSP